ncbi:MAG: ATP-binding protein [Chloroflexota bacterium]|nr:ATP-binding protein [Chloroflexota bacterium]
MGETVSLRPTKELFIDVLTRDISVHDCILDLLDNAVDSYTKNGIAERREIRLDYGQDGLRLVDNCGGIPKVRFMSEVFRLGSSDPTSSGPTIGVYGIGLKRSVFKLGRLIVVETDDGRDYCRLKIDVDQWLSEPDNWEVPLTESSPSRLGGGGLPYTSIEVSKLTRAAKETFTPEFERRLKETVKIYYSLFIQDGQIGFFLNDEEQTGFELTVKAGADYMPVRVADKYDGAEIDIISS